MGDVRPVTPNDGPRLAELHESVFGKVGVTEEQIRQAYTSETFSLLSEHRYGKYASPSLVFEEDNRIIGFVLAICRPVMFEGDRLWAASTSHLAVEPDARSSLAAIHLLRAVTEGPQDLTYVDRSNRAGRKSAQAAGFVPIPSHSLRWTRMMKPSAAASVRLARKTRAPFLRDVGPRIEALLPDQLRGRIQDELPSRPPGITSEPLTVEHVAETGHALLTDKDLHPVLDDPDHVAHEWNQLDKTYANCDIVRRVLLSKRGDVVGWYIFLINDDESAEVLQFVAKPAVQRMAFITLLHDIADTRSITASGHLPPELLYDIEELECELTTDAASALVHSSSADILSAFSGNRFWLSALEGESLVNPVAAVPR